ncbi:helix-turn-helix transcriptional regulator [Candidatus Amarolinea dominans]|uniref:helix-turn-helix domain-containing protein n=1 Tax=Candidatus Amarolinea dominans TaxID=3140696 RepID=UPI003136C035|nr:helix-turn-helix transcriptional regulator [Anaerolineae bacterium]
MEDLWKVRKRKRMTIGELSGRTGISSKVLRRYEMGEIPIPLTDIERLARSLYVEPWEIKIQSDPPPMPPPAPFPSAAAAGAAPRPAPFTPQPPASPPAGPGPALPPSPSDGDQRPPGNRPAGPPRPEGGAPRYAASDRRPPRRERPDRGERPDQEHRAPPIPGPVRPSQVAHLLSLGTRLGVEQSQLEAEVGKPLSEMNRREASLLLGSLQKRIVEEHPNRPKGKRQRPYLPESVDEFEFKYLTAIQTQGALLDFKLFDGSQVVGQVIGFSPYAITVREPSGAETTIQKLAIAYYRQPPTPVTL